MTFKEHTRQEAHASRGQGSSLNPGLFVNGLRLFIEPSIGIMHFLLTGRDCSLNPVRYWLLTGQDCSLNPVMFFFDFPVMFVNGLILWINSGTARGKWG
jgi:hypothetical protein